MTIDLNKLVELIDFGSDIEFSYKGKSYIILPWVKEGIVIGEQNKDNDSIYKTSRELVDNYKIDGKLIKDIIGEIKIIFHS